MAAGCRSSGESMNDHWSERSVAPRVSRFFLGYDAEKDGDYRDFQWERKQDINLTLRRHFLNHNPDNPHQPDVPSRYKPRPPHSLLPNPVPYIHLEGLLLGFALMGATGTFIPLPIDSILGTLEPGGVGEFTEGVARTFHPIGVIIVTPLQIFTGGEAKASYAAPVEVK
jgi:hypothetical protein